MNVKEACLQGTAGTYAMTALTEMPKSDQLTTENVADYLTDPPSATLHWCRQKGSVAGEKLDADTRTVATWFQWLKSPSCVCVGVTAEACSVNRLFRLTMENSSTPGLEAAAALVVKALRHRKVIQKFSV